MINLHRSQDAGAPAIAVDVPSYISGYVDGEGCFTVSVAPRQTLKVGWEVRSDLTIKWEIRSLRPLVEAVNPHFRRYPLISGKRRDFELFASICEAMIEGRHRDKAGLAEVVKLASERNPSGTRRYDPVRVISILMEMKA